MARGGSGLEFDLSGLVNGLASFDNRFEQMVVARAETSAQRLEAYAKQNRPWTDRTGQARQRLNCRVSRTGRGQFTLTLAHGVSYGADLEFLHDKRYAIIFPTLETQGPKVIQAFAGLLEGR